jgi:TatD DNase family protein
MDLVDVHAHLDHEQFENDLEEVLARAKAKGVKKVVAQGTNHESNLKVLELTEKHEMVEAALGLYPSESLSVKTVDEYIKETSVDDEETLNFIRNNSEKIVAIGEVGMDFKESEDKEKQSALFRNMILLAREIHKPLIIHSRKAEKEILDILEEMDFKRVVMHCFMGSKKLLKRGVEMGLYFSVPPAVLRVEQFQQNVEMIPVTQLFTETDAPWMGPSRDLRNEPGNVRDAVMKIAEIKRMDPKEVANQLYFNYQKLFQ